MSAYRELRLNEQAIDLLGRERLTQLSARKLGQPAMVRDMVLKGLLVESAHYVCETSGVPRRLFDQVISRSTLRSASKRKSQRLSKRASEALLRLVRTIALAEEVFGDRERAIFWLTTPNPVFEEEAPITLVDTESGTDWVEQTLVRTMHGVCA
ncbi:hypothetical protein SADO_14644 [Salinisphaera dokdonensis CL-ES53]|uniref:Antitoxin Xre/MbcA/ParS-like toxin-binding domain-containing protein n=1 Tax=Salinisphaera dokdonensis CL-ES53 TaxID=1304272 RepID=A0ABV2B3R2_9GAMM